MGRKKKKQMKPWCWYCNREFDDEKILIQHQKAKHFKCHICHKKLYTGPGLSIHCMQVHKEKVDKVPNAIPGRQNIEVEIYGMEGIPEDDARSHEKGKTGKESTKDSPQHIPSYSGGLLPTPTVGPLMPPDGMPLMRPPTTSAGGMPPMGGMPMGQMAGPMGQMRPVAPPMGHMGHMGPVPPMPGMMPPSRPAMPGMSMARMPPGMGGGVKPLFPVQGGQMKGSAPVGPDFKPTNAAMSMGGGMGPMRPTFPAYSAGAPPGGGGGQISAKAVISAAPTTIKKPESSSGLTIKLVHPDEDISLEEMRADMSRYRGQPSQPMAPAEARLPPQMAAPSRMMSPPRHHMPPGGMAMQRAPMGMMAMAPALGYPPMMRAQMMPPQPGGRY